MKRINGIKSVDFFIKAEGFGVVNWNGSASLYSEQAGKNVNNHLLPKMRGIDMLTISKMKDIDHKARLYISQNCVKNALFKDFTYGLKEVTLSNVNDVLCSLVGLVRGYVIAEGSTSLKRKSSLFIEDFLSTPDVSLNYEQFSQSAARNETSIFSKHTTGATNYVAYGSINIEDLQFLPLEDSLGRSCYREVVTESEGQDLATKITQFLKELDFSQTKNPQVIFSNNYLRINSICKQGEAGLLLNDDAIDLVVTEIINIIKDLFISRSRAYVEVKELLIDYNEGKALRIKHSKEDINPSKDRNYAVYYEAQPFSAEEYAEQIKRVKAEKDAKKKKETKKVKEMPVEPISE